MPTLTPLKSSNLEGCAYDKAKRALTVKFKGGGTYVYEDVEPHLHDQLKGAESPGKFFFGFIKNRHRYTRIDTPAN